MPIPVNGVNYSKLCRKILKREWGTGFSNFIMFNRNIEDVYVEGLSLTHGPHGKRWHIWTCTASVIEPYISNMSIYLCPCTNSSDTWSHSTPWYISSDYFCDTNSHGLLVPYFNGNV